MRRLIARLADFIRESDKILLLLCIFTSLYGCLAVFSATYYMENIRRVIIQCASMVIGVTLALVISTIDYSEIISRWKIVGIAALIPVILTFFIGFAPEGTDDKAWLDLGFTTFQPAELLKIAFMVTFSFHLSKAKPNINKWKTLIPLCIHGGFPVLLIHFQGDDGTALVFAIMMAFMLWAAGLSWKYFVVALSALIVASPILFFFVMNEEQRKRIEALFDPNADIKGILYQQWLGRKALANGGFVGQGLLKGDLTQSGMVPEGHNDFIFVSIGEELGFLGCIAVVILLGGICLRCLMVAKNCSMDTGKFICVGFFAMIFAQTVVNIGMCVSLLPVIGITLPFFSAGGSSLICLYLGVGLVLSVYMHRNSRTIYLRDGKNDF